MLDQKDRLHFLHIWKFNRWKLCHLDRLYIGGCLCRSMVGQEDRIRHSLLLYIWWGPLRWLFSFMGMLNMFLRRLSVVFQVGIEFERSFSYPHPFFQLVNIFGTFWCPGSKKCQVQLNKACKKQFQIHKSVHHSNLDTGQWYNWQTFPLHKKYIFPLPSWTFLLDSRNKS